MALSNDQIKQVLSYAAFNSYSLEQRNELENYLKQASFALNIAQMELLFGDTASGGMITNLIDDFPESWEKREENGQLLELYQILQKVNNINPSDFAGEKPIIENLIGRLGGYNETIVSNVTHLVRTHITIISPDILSDEKFNFFLQEQKGINIVKELDKNERMLFSLMQYEDFSFDKKFIEKLMVFEEKTNLNVEKLSELSALSLRLLFIKLKIAVLEDIANLIYELLKTNKVSWDDISSLSQKHFFNLVTLNPAVTQLCWYLKNSEFSLKELLDFDNSDLDLLLACCDVFDKLISANIMYLPDLMSLDGEVLVDLVNAKDLEEAEEIIQQNKSNYAP